MEYDIKAALNGLKTELENHIDNKMGMPTSGQENRLKNMISDNLEVIAEMNSAKPLLIKDMTVAGNLTGDQPRDYRNGVVADPSEIVNFADLIRTVTIEGGTYTYMKETGKTGAPGKVAEGATKEQVDYDLTAFDVALDYLASFTVFSKKMKNNIGFLTGFLSYAMRRDWLKAENADFNTQLSNVALPSDQVSTDTEKIEMIINDVARLEGNDYVPDTIIMQPSDYWSIMTMSKDESGYGLPAVASYSNGVLRINGIKVYRANWITANKYFVGAFTQINKIVSTGLDMEFSESDDQNFRKNLITARIEQMEALAVYSPAAIIIGDFLAI